MRRLIAASSVAFTCALISAAGASAETQPSATPTPQVTTSAHARSHSSGHKVSLAIKAANDAYVAAVAQAQSSFDRAVADAAAVRDQEILATPTDKVAVKSARDAYKASFTQLKQLFQANLASAKQARDAAIAAAKQ